MFVLPQWLKDLETQFNSKDLDSEPSHLMSMTLDVLDEAIKQGGTGPFSAGIWDKKGKCISLGVNLVVSSGQSMAHAEMVAISLAQEKLGTWDLASYPGGLTLVCSCEPCAMCYGGSLWSGVSQLLYSATKEDAEAIGFKEGLKPENWIEACRDQGVRVAKPLLSKRGRDLLFIYQHQGGTIYNSQNT